MKDITTNALQPTLNLYQVRLEPKPIRSNITDVGDQFNFDATFPPSRLPLRAVPPTYFFPGTTVHQPPTAGLIFAWFRM